MLVYEIECAPIRAAGYALDGTSIGVVAPQVRAILEDNAGVAEATEALSEVVKTNFESERLRQVLAPRSTYEEWRVGEALAEVHLTHAEGCVFPWPDSRSVRNLSSSSGGVDLIGVHEGDRTRFVFAEVKTSHQQAWPPSVATSRTHGLGGQLSGLIAGDDRLQSGMRYLVMNGIDRPWFDKVKEAIKTYLENRSDVALFGVLVHAASANDMDLRNLAKDLARVHVEPASSALVAIYAAAEHLAKMASGQIELETAA